MSLALGIKLLASPALIGLASLAGKRWGPTVAGLIGGLPLVGGPVVLVLWLTEGGVLAAEVSRAAPVGIWATIVYLLVLGHASARWPWYFIIPLGWVFYLLLALLIEATGLAQSLTLGLAVIPALWLAATRALPQPGVSAVVVHLPRIELAARMAAAVALVLTLTGAAALLGPDLTGLLSGAPVSATVIPAFLFANAGRDALLLALRGFLTGLTGFATFFLVLAPCIEPWGWFALAPAALAACVIGAVATRMFRPAERPAV